MPSDDERDRGRRDRAYGDVWLREGRAARGRAPARSRDEIVTAAIALADEGGFEHVSMRRVAQRLGVGTMTLYWYVQSKDELLDLMLDEIMAAQLVPAPPPADWREALREIARRTRDVQLRFPWILQVGWTRPGVGPNALRRVEQSLAAVEPLGLPRSEAMAILVAVDDYTIGFASREAARIRTEQQQGMTGRQWIATLTPFLQTMVATGEYPLLATMLDGEIDLPGEDRFDRGLDWVLDGIAAALADGTLGSASPRS